MLNIKKGDVLQRKDSLQKIKVLAIVDGLYAVSSYIYHDKFGNLLTENQIREYFTLPEEKWEPGNFEEYYYITESGQVKKDVDVNMPIKASIRYVLGVYRTSEEAQAKLDEILAVLKK